MDLRAIEYCANEKSGKVGLFCKVQRVWNLRCVGIIGPGCLRRAIHSSAGILVENVWRGVKSRALGTGWETSGL